MTYFSPGAQPVGGARGRPRQPVSPSDTGSATPAPAREVLQPGVDVSSSVEFPAPPTGDAMNAPAAEAFAAQRPGTGAEQPPDPAAHPASHPTSARRPAAPRTESSAAYPPEEPPGDLAGLFPSREPGRREPDEPSVIDLTRAEDPAPPSGEQPAQGFDRAVPPGFPVELPQPSLRREQLLLSAVSWLIVLFTVLLGALGGLTYSSLKTAKYTATSSVVVTAAKGAPAQSSAPSFAKVYAQVATGTPAFQQALADAGISMGVDNARKHLQVSAPDGSPLIVIRATAGNGADAAALANAAATGIAYGPDRAAVTGFNVTRFTTATEPTTATKPHRALSVLVGALIGLAVGGVVVVVVRRSRRMSVGTST